MAICVFVTSLGLFWTKACVEESLHAFVLYLFSYAIFPYVLTSNAFNCVIIFSGTKASLLLSKEVLLIIRTSRCCWTGFICPNWLKKVQTSLI
jgi:hypothetical protein